MVVSLRANELCFKIMLLNGRLQLNLHYYQGTFNKVNGSECELSLIITCILAGNIKLANSRFMNCKNAYFLQICSG